MGSTRTYRMTPEGLQRMHEAWLKRLRGRRVVFGPAFMITVAYFTMPSIPAWALGLFAMGGVLMAFAMPHVTSIQLRAQFETFELEISSDSLLRRQKGFRDLSISREEVRGLVEGDPLMLIVRTHDFHKVLHIPKQIEGFEEIRATLSGWAGPVSAMSERLYKLVLAGSGILTLVAHQAPNWTQNPSLLLLAHVAAAAAALWLFVELRRSPAVEDNMRKYSWLVLIWVVFELRAAWHIFETEWPGT